jgi:spore germination cell wall hydrolase CwlJ-like protein
MRPGHLRVFYALNDTEAAILTIYGEARGEPFEGKQAVGVVIANRAAKQNKPVKEICYAANQFSCYLSADPNYFALFNFAHQFDLSLTSNAGLQECAKAWSDACPEIQARLDGATFYEVRGTKNNWFDKQKTIGKLILTASIGAHDFYKEAA